MVLIMMKCLVFRNTWSDGKKEGEKPKIQGLGENGVLCTHPRLGKTVKNPG